MEIIVKNNIWARYDYITLWIDEEEYHLKPESEISIEVFSNKFSVEYSLFFSKSKKIFLEFSDNEEVYLSLNYNRYFILYCIGVLSVFFIACFVDVVKYYFCLLYTSDAADE